MRVQKYTWVSEQLQDQAIRMFLGVCSFTDWGHGKAYVESTQVYLLSQLQRWTHCNSNINSEKGASSTLSLISRHIFSACWIQPLSSLFWVFCLLLLHAALPSQTLALQHIGIHHTSSILSSTVQHFLVQIHWINMVNLVVITYQTLFA